MDSSKIFNCRICWNFWGWFLHLSSIFEYYGYPVAQIIEFNDFWTFDNLSKTESFSTFDVYFDIFKPFAIDWYKKKGDNLIFTQSYNMLKRHKKFEKPNHWTQWLSVQDLSSSISWTSKQQSQRNIPLKHLQYVRVCLEHLVDIDCWYRPLTLCHWCVFEIHLTVNGGLVNSSCSSILDLKPTPDPLPPPPRSRIYQWCFTGSPLPIFSWSQSGGVHCYFPESMLKYSSHSLLRRQVTKESNCQANIW